MRRWSNTYLLIYLFNTLTYFTGFVCVDRPGFPLMAPRSKGFFFVKFVFTVVARCFDEKIVKKNNNKRDVPNKGRTLYEAMQHPKPTESCIQQIRIHRPGFASDFQRNIFFFVFIFCFTFDPSFDGAEIERVCLEFVFTVVVVVDLLSFIALKRKIVLKKMKEK